MIYLGIGSNLGDRRKNIEIAKFEIAQKGVNIINCSNFYESLSWPDINYPKFLNIVLRVDTNLTPLKLLDYKKKQINNKIILPHPRLHQRNFVLLPLFELDKSWIHPVSKYHIKKLIFYLPNRDIRSIKQI